MQLRIYMINTNYNAKLANNKRLAKIFLITIISNIKNQFWQNKYSRGNHMVQLTVLRLPVY